MNLKAIFFVLTLFLLFFISCNNQSEECKNSAKKNGKVRLESNKVTTIAITTKASDREKFAAHELISYLSKITGREIPLLNVEDSVISDGTIAVGQLAVKSGLISPEELKPVADDGFVIKINGKKGAICGCRDLGTVYGAYELLKRIGVKFYSQDCEIIPNKPDLIIPELDLSITPHYDLRAIFKLDVYYHGLQPSLKLGYTPNNDLGYHGDLGAPGERNWVHSAGFLIPYRKFGKEHPEFFALQKNGKRDEGMGRLQLCLSNETMRKAGAEQLLWLIGQQKERTYFVVSQSDGFSDRWCHCQDCQALDAQQGQMTDRLMDYVNYNARIVTKEFPGKKILTLAYTPATSRPPINILPDSNVMIMFCPLHPPNPPDTECHSHGLDCPKNSWALEQLKGWLSLCPDNMYVFDYPRNYVRWYEPFGSFYAMVDKLNFYSSAGVRGIVYCVVPTNFRDLFMFVQSRLLWQPDSNVEDLIDEFMSVYYGPAASTVREYFDFMNNEINLRSIHQMCEKSNPELVTPEFAGKALEMFERAQAAVVNDSVYLRRVEAEKFCVLWSDIDQRNTIKDNIKTGIVEHTERFGELIRIAKEMGIIQVGGNLGFKEWVHSVSLLRLQSELWYNDPAVDALMNQPENLFKLW
ncbi:MAG: hypothetical protein A2W90_17750 [Bacteroidetes bacterium GWF2_42_66]|nr:MAG: hypothetical protein A2W92_16595 [Bacteroidetes bacterium GWA2_42_15]OFX98100.1 MAG: hypothetical protein A2W89_09240 [Bacteroidetes bacterium GWE2_42_39]OFY42484.1 MAG: hypothetical protein A2W90_17750 [Bacteroidetes bacterium GWF2_42_66]HBL74197.1 hypothetical protein [Prolixibacteraceae bacterium]HCR91682.1 hypothetical protein [Prolixibacteraceae bacterium]